MLLLFCVCVWGGGEGVVVFACCPKHTYRFSQFDDCFLSTDVLLEVGVRLSPSVVIFCERNVGVILQTTANSELQSQV